MARNSLLQSEIPGIPVRRGKVRDVYDFGDRLLFVATDRISAFDWVLPSGIPDKGRVLTKLSEMWFGRLDVPHHLLSMDLDGVRLPAGIDRESLVGRSMVVKKTEVVPIECVVRGYLSGSGWKEYQKTASVCGIKLPAGLTESDRLPEPIFTPATKEETGHDINISFERMCEIVGRETARRLRTLSLEIYRRGAEYALRKGIMIADTKFEFGSAGRAIDPDRRGADPRQLAILARGRLRAGPRSAVVRQAIRPRLAGDTGWDKNSPPPALPDEVVRKTRGKYVEAYTRLVGQAFPWEG